MSVEDKHIKISENGPYLISGGIPLVKLKAITDSLGYPYKWVEEIKLATGRGAHDLQTYNLSVQKGLIFIDI